LLFLIYDSGKAGFLQRAFFLLFAPHFIFVVLLACYQNTLSNLQQILKIYHESGVCFINGPGSAIHSHFPSGETHSPFNRVEETKIPWHSTVIISGKLAKVLIKESNFYVSLPRSFLHFRQVFMPRNYSYGSFVSQNFQIPSSLTIVHTCSLSKGHVSTAAPLDAHVNVSSPVTST